MNKKIIRKGYCLLIVILILVSAVPAYAAETNDDVKYSNSTRATILSTGDYLSGPDERNTHYFEIDTAGNYTFTLVVDAMDGAGARVVFKKVNASTDIFSRQVFSGNYQNRCYLSAGTYLIEIQAWDALAYSIIVSN